MKKQVKSGKSQSQDSLRFFLYLFVWGLSIGLSALSSAYGSEGEAKKLPNTAEGITFAFGAEGGVKKPPNATEGIISVFGTEAGEDNEYIEKMRRHSFDNYMKEESKGKGYWTAVHFLEGFAKKKKGKGSLSEISSLEIDKEKFLQFLDNWNKLSKKQKKQAFKTIQTAEGSNLFHLIAQVPLPPEWLKDELALIFIQAEAILGKYRLFDMLIQRNSQRHTPFDLANDASIKEQLGQFEFYAHNYLKKSAKEDFMAGAVMGVTSVLLAAATNGQSDLNPSDLIIPGMAATFGAVKCYGAFKKMLGLSNTGAKF